MERCNAAAASEVQGYDFDRMTVEFTMLNQGKVIIVRDQYCGDGQY
jgi:hypothetical protein